MTLTRSGANEAGRPPRWVRWRASLTFVTKVACALVLGFAVGPSAGCGPVVADDDGASEETDDVDETWMLGVFSRGKLEDSFGSAEFTPDGQFIRRDVTSCGRHEYTYEYTWSLLESGEVQIEYVASDGTISHSIVRQDGCDEGVQKLVWESYQESPPVTFEESFWRGDLCATVGGTAEPDPETGEPCHGPGCTQCNITWCDEPPPPCEE
jgi:hypothetical protein